MKDKSKIEGAYLLLKRFKNRLKTLDIALENMNNKKTDKRDFEIFQNSLAKDRAQAIFDDMKMLFDATVLKFDEKIEYERNQIKRSYEKIVTEHHQRSMQDFEKRYN